MKITELMEKSVHTCLPENTLEEAANKMLKWDVGALPVVESGNKLLGMVTDRDICMCGLIEGQPLRELPVSLATSAHAWACKQEDSIDEVFKLMQTHKVHRVPVVDKENKLVGIVGMGDIIRATTKKKHGATPQVLVKTLAAIAEPHALAAAARAKKPVGGKQLT